MRHRSMWAAGGIVAMLGCGDGGTSPRSDDDGRRMAAQFEQLADSVDGTGDSPTAEALRHAARIVRLTGHATPVTLVIDDQPRSFLSVAEQLDFPTLVCTYPGDSGGGTIEPGDSGRVAPPPSPADTASPDCVDMGTYSMRTLIAWEPDHMAEVVRVVSDVGTTVVDSGVPDVMTGLPSTVNPDGTVPPEPGDTAVSGGGTGGTPGGYPGFMGEYLVADVGSWWATEGTQSNALEEITGSCTEDRATIDWAEFDCAAARFRFELAMRVEAPRYGPPTGIPGGDSTVTGSGGGNGSGGDGAQGSHTVALANSKVDGVRLTVVAWLPPPLPPEPVPPLPVPPPGSPEPVDSTGAVRE